MPLHGRRENAIEYDLQTTLDDCIDEHHTIVAGLRQVVLRNRSDAVDLHPTPVVYVTVKAKQRGARESLTIEVGWKPIGISPQLAAKTIKSGAPEATGDRPRR